MRAISTSSWPTPTVSMRTKSLAGGVEQQRQVAVARARPPRRAARGHGADEDAGIGVVALHADAVAQDGAAGERAGGIDGDDADGLALRAEGGAPGRSTSVLLPAPGGPVMPTTTRVPGAVAQVRRSELTRLGGSPFSMPVAARASARAGRLREICSRPVAVHQLFEQLPRDHQPLDLAGAFADGAELDVAVELLHRIVLDEAVAAVNLDGLVRDAHGGLGREQLGHGGFAGDAPAAI